VKHLSIVVPKLYHRKIKEIAAREGKTITRLILDLLEQEYPELKEVNDEPK
jgi:predicted DNA-binding ribbon-helix-helix protein